MGNAKSDKSLESRPRLIVALGASAGGLAAIEAFFDKMPPQSGLAFAVISHHQLGAPSMMPELLARHTSMPIEVAVDGVAMEANRVYVVRAETLVGLSEGKFVMTARGEGDHQPLSIDHFFDALALDQGSKAVAIVLSGAGSDGSLGVRSIKAESGLVIVQDPKTAQFPSMPVAAISVGNVDHVLSPEEMPEILLQRATAQELPVRLSDGASDLMLHLPSILSYLRVHSGHDFSGYKPSTLVRRIQRRVLAGRAGSVREYVEHLRADPAEVRSLFQELTIGVTAFFRDGDAFEALRQALQGTLASQSGSLAIRGWVPGCSTGEEAYSLGMLLRETIDQADRYRSARVFATDIDARAVSVARAATYPATISNDVSPGRLARFALATEDGYQIRNELREMMIFAVHNLISDPPFTRIDVLSCRNLLIYLDAKLQREVLAMFHYALNPGGLLFLGSAETLGSLADSWIAVDKRWNLFRKREVTPRIRTGIPFIRPTDVIAFPQAGNQATRVAVTAIADSVLAGVLVGPSVIVDEHGQILHIHGRTGEFLEPTPGEPSMNLFRMARDGLRTDLAPALRQVANTGVPRVLKGLRVKTNGDSVTADVRVCRVDHTPFGAQAFIVVFERQDHTDGSSSQAPMSLPGSSQGRLEIELQELKETLHSTIEEYETANEELKASNEELQSANEELQSANEELETSKEEQQSLNEELQTVNAELKDKVENLSRAHDDMRNLLNSTDVATLFLDTELRIKRFTPGATGIANLIQTDVGRPISDMGMKIEAPNLIADMKDVLRTLVFKQGEVRGTDGTWYLMRILPYRTAENVIDGVVVTFVDVTELKRVQEQAERGRRVTERLVRAIAQPTVILDDKYNIMVANSAFAELAGMQRERLEGRSLFTVLPEVENMASFLGEAGLDGRGRAVELSLTKGKAKVLLFSERLNADGTPDDLTLVSFKKADEEGGG